MASEKKPHNPFQQLGEEQAPPDRIRKKVMTSVKFSQMMLHVLDLYFNKTVAMISVLVNTNHKKSNVIPRDSSKESIHRTITTNPLSYGTNKSRD